MSGAVRAVLFDADGVLQQVPGGAEESMRPAVEGRVADVPGFLADALATERPSLAGQERWLDVLPALLDRWGLAEAYDEVVAAWLAIEPVPGAREIVEAVRETGVEVHLASNQDVARAARMQELFDYDALFGTAFYSHALGVAKPDPGYFTAIVQRIDVPAGEVLFLDDNSANVEAARSVGLRAETWVHTDGLDRLRALLAGHGLHVAA